MRFIALFLSILAFVAQPSAAASSPSLLNLEQQLNSLVASKSADVGIAALDLNTGEIVSVKGNTPFPMASTVKVAVAALYLAQVDNGRRSLDDTINGQSARSLMARMLIHSDNRATDILLQDLGGPNAVHDWLSDNGVTGLRVDRTIASLGSGAISGIVTQHARRDGRPAEAHLQGQLIKPETQLPARSWRARDGKNRMKAMLPYGRLSSTRPGHSTASPRRRLHHAADGRRVAVDFTRGGADRPQTSPNRPGHLLWVQVGLRLAIRYPALNAQ
jgi:beta-lactamase class A